MNVLQHKLAEIKSHFGGYLNGSFTNQAGEYSEEVLAGHPWTTASLIP